MATESFGPSALATPANAFTLARLFLTPVLLVLVLAQGASATTVSLWIVLACTDGVDGILARRMGTTRSGAFLDPLADKFLVLGAMGALVAEGVLWWVPVVLLGVRELSISLFRAAMGRQGITVPARWWAKVKTVLQSVAVGFALLPATTDHRWPANVFLWVSVVLAIVTGVQYFLDGNTYRRTAAGAV